MVLFGRDTPQFANLDAVVIWCAPSCIDLCGWVKLKLGIVICFCFRLYKAHGYLEHRRYCLSLYIAWAKARTAATLAQLSLFVASLPLFAACAVCA